jgi:hypothetical protein
VTTTTVRATSAAFGSAYTRFNAGISSVLPLPRKLSMVRSACSMLARVAGTDLGASNRLLPENSSTLKVSLGLRPPTSSRNMALDVSSGKPCMEPEMSTTKMYSRGLIAAGSTWRGGCTIARKKFSSGPRYSITPDCTASPASR